MVEVNDKTKKITIREITDKLKELFSDKYKGDEYRVIKNNRDETSSIIDIKRKSKKKYDTSLANVIDCKNLRERGKPTTIKVEVFKKHEKDKDEVIPKFEKLEETTEEIDEVIINYI